MKAISKPTTFKGQKLYTVVEAPDDNKENLEKKARKYIKTEFKIVE